MATDGAALPQVAAAGRVPSGSRTSAVRSLALLGALRDRAGASGRSSSCSTVRARSRSTRRSSRARSDRRTASATCSRSPRPLIFSALAVAVCFKGGHVQHRRRGAVPRRDGDGAVGGAQARLPPRPAPDDRGDPVRAMLGGMVWAVDPRRS